MRGRREVDHVIFERQSVEEERYGYVQNAGNIVQGRCAHPVRTAFILLNLLKTDSDFLAEFYLRNAYLQPPAFYTCPYVPVYRVNTGLFA